MCCFFFQGDLDWIAAYSDEFGSNYIIRDIVYIKTAKREANLDFTLAMYVTNFEKQLIFLNLMTL